MLDKAQIHDNPCPCMLVGNWLTGLACSITFFMHVKVWAVYRADLADLWALYTLCSTLAIFAKLSYYPAERALAIYMCLLPARMMLVWRGHQFTQVDLPTDTTSTDTTREDDRVELQVSVGVGLLVKVLAGRLMRTFYASHNQEFTPARVKLLARDPVLALFECVDGVCAAHLRFIQPKEQGCQWGVGMDQGLVVAMPVAAMALTLTRYSDWFERGGGRYVGDLPYWLNVLTIILVEWHDLANAFAKTSERCERRPSNGPTSLSDFLAKSKIPENLKGNPVLL